MKPPLFLYSHRSQIESCWDMVDGFIALIVTIMFCKQIQIMNTTREFDLSVLFAVLSGTADVGFVPEEVYEYYVPFVSLGRQDFKVHLTNLLRTTHIAIHAIWYHCLQLWHSIIALELFILSYIRIVISSSACKNYSQLWQPLNLVT